MQQSGTERTGEPRRIFARTWALQFVVAKNFAHDVDQLGLKKTGHQKQLVNAITERLPLFPTFVFAFVAKLAQRNKRVVLVIPRVTTASVVPMVNHQRVILGAAHLATEPITLKNFKSPLLPLWMPKFVRVLHQFTSL
jgi:hypothetical protein